jgi:hypothetical protein
VVACTLFCRVYVLIVCVVSNILIALLLQSFGISSSHTRYRQDGFVEIWEHLLARAQLDLFTIDAARFVRPIMFTFHRRHAFMTVNETLFGEALSLEFEVDADEVEFERNAVAQWRTNDLISTGVGPSQSKSSSVISSLASAFFGNLVTGLHGIAAIDETQLRGFSSLRVHSRFDPVTYAANVSSRTRALTPQIAHGLEQRWKSAKIIRESSKQSVAAASPLLADRMFATTRSLTEFVRSALVLDSVKLMQVAQGDLNVGQMMKLVQPRSAPEHSSEPPGRGIPASLDLSDGHYRELSSDTVTGDSAASARSTKLQRIAHLAKALAAEHESLRQQDRENAAHDIPTGRRIESADGPRRPFRPSLEQSASGEIHADLLGDNQPTLARSVNHALGAMRRMFSSNSLAYDASHASVSSQSSLLQNEMPGMSRNHSQFDIPPHSRRGSANSDNKPAPDPVVGPTPTRRLRTGTLLGETVHLAAGSGPAASEPSVVIRPDGFVYIPE